MYEVLLLSFQTVGPWKAFLTKAFIALARKKMPGGKKDGNCCQKFQDGVFGNMEKGFQKFGTLVGGSPYITILIGLLVSGLFMIGLIQFRDEEEMVKLWVPDESEFYNKSGSYYL